MKAIDGSYEGYTISECQRCGEVREIHFRTDGGFDVCDSCTKKIIFDRSKN